MSLKGTRQLGRLIDCRVPLMKDLVAKLHRDSRPTYSTKSLENIAVDIIREYFLLYNKDQLCDDLRNLYTCCSLAQKNEDDYIFLFQVAGEISSKLINSSADFQIHPDSARILELEPMYTELCYCFSCELLERYFSLSEKIIDREIKKLRDENRLAILSVIAPSRATSTQNALCRLINLLK